MIQLIENLNAYEPSFEQPFQLQRLITSDRPDFHQPNYWYISS